MYKGRVESDVQQLIREGRRDRAFEKILDLYQTKVFRLVFVLVRNTARAEEVAQDALFKIWQALERYDGRAALGTWIYTIARNTALPHLRSELYRRTVPLDSVAEPVAAPGNPNDEIRKLVESLPEEQRDVVVLYYYQEQSVEEVARMSTSRSTTFRRSSVPAAFSNASSLRSNSSHPLTPRFWCLAKPALARNSLPTHSIGSAPAAIFPSSASTAPPFPLAFSKVNSSAMRKEPSPAAKTRV